MAKKARTLISFDWAMKKMLRQKANFDILEGFLSELLKEDVRIQSILDPASNKNTSDDKFNIIDILVKDTKDQIIAIELQYNRETDYFHRMLFATSKVNGEYLKTGFEYGKIKKAYSINLLYFELGQGIDYVYHGTTNFKGIHLHDELQLSEKQRQVYLKDQIFEIFPEYYVIQINKFNDISKDTLDEWIYFLKHSDLPDTYSAKGLDKVAEKLKLDQMTEAQRAAYQHHLKSKYSAQNIVETARSEGRDEGLEEGALLEKQLTACNLKKLGVLNIEQIALVTGLSVQQIENLNCD